MLLLVVLGSGDSVGTTNKMLVQIIVESYNNGEPTPVFNNAAQTWNHTFFWESMKPGGGGELPNSCYIFGKGLWTIWECRLEVETLSSCRVLLTSNVYHTGWKVLYSGYYNVMVYISLSLDDWDSKGPQGTAPLPSACVKFNSEQPSTLCNLLEIAELHLQCPACLR